MPTTRPHLRWFPRLGQVTTAPMRLIAFAYAGGSAATFANWPQAISKAVEFHALQLPGRSDRLTEKPIAQVPELIEQLQEMIQPLTDKPLIFFGHSNGGLIAYELARALQAQAEVDVRHLVISSKPAPHIKPRRLRHVLNNEELIEELRHFGGTPEAVLNHPVFMEMMLPAIRADFSLSETYQHVKHKNEQASLDADTSLWWGDDDLLAPQADVLAWKPYLGNVVDTRGFEGGHFYLHEQRRAVIEQLNGIIESHA